MNSEERYNTWLKDALAYGYNMSDIEGILGSDPSKSQGDVIIEGFISEKIVSSYKDGTVYFMITETTPDKELAEKFVKKLVKL